MATTDDYDQLEGEHADTLVWLDESLSYGFAQVPRPVLRAKGLSLKAKLVYTALVDYSWQKGRCFPGQQRLAEDLDISMDSVQRALEELKRFKLVDWKRQGLTKPNIYYLLPLSQNPHLNLNRSLKPQIAVSGSRSAAASENRRVRHKKYSVEKDSVEEYEVISKERKSNLFNSNSTGARLSTSVRGQSIVENPPTSGLAEDAPQVLPDRKRPSSIGQILAQRYPNGPTVTGSSAAPGRGRPPKAPEFLATTMEEITHRLNDDPKNVRSNTTRATKLWKASGLPEDKFVTSVLYKARSLAQQQGNVTKRAGAGAGGIINRVPYFFAVVEDLLGLKGSAVDPS